MKTVKLSDLLHPHPGLQANLCMDEEHIIVDRKAWEQIKDGESVPAEEYRALLEALGRCNHYLADLNGGNWMADDGPGGIDMRQRARALQSIVLAAIKKQRASP